MTTFCCESVKLRCETSREKSGISRDDKHNRQAGPTDAICGRKCGFQLKKIGGNEENQRWIVSESCTFVGRKTFWNKFLGALKCFVWHSRDYCAIRFVKRCYNSTAYLVENRCLVCLIKYASLFMNRSRESKITFLSWEFKNRKRSRKVLLSKEGTYLSSRRSYCT